MIRDMEALERAVKQAGGVSKLALSIGVRQSAVSNWKAREEVPLDQCAAIEAATGIRCEELRPDVSWTRDERGQVNGYHVPLPPAEAA